MNEELRERIEKLKDPNEARQAEWLKKYRPKAYAILLNAGRENRLWLNCSGQWITDPASPIGSGDCCILKPDYDPEPEPEYDKFPLCVVDGKIGIWRYGFQKMEIAEIQTDFHDFTKSNSGPVARFVKEPQ